MIIFFVVSIAKILALEMQRNVPGPAKAGWETLLEKIALKVKQSRILRLYFNAVKIYFLSKYLLS